MEFHPNLGKMEFADDYRQLQVKASLLRSRRAFLEEMVGVDAVDLASAQLEGSVRDYLMKPPLINIWVPYGPLVDLDTFLIEGPAAGNLYTMRTVTRMLAVRNLSSIYRIFIGLGSPNNLLAKLDVAFRTMFSAGRIEVERIGPKHARAVLRDVVLPLYKCGYGITGWLEAALDLCGAKDVDVEHYTCVHLGDKECSWDVIWD